MTSPSRRKHPITLRSTRRNSAVAGWIVTAMMVITTVCGTASAQESGRDMLDRLRDRDAGARWRRASQTHPYRPQLESAPAPTLILGRDGGELNATPVQFAEDYGQPALKEATITPRELKKIGEILPYWNYDPNNEDDPCLYLCPRPGEDACPAPEDADLTPACPDEVTLGDEVYRQRAFPGLNYYWTASNNHYQPLYFQDVGLERYGHEYPMWAQPGVSLGLFCGQVIGIPYQMGLDPPWKKEYSLGYYQPGEPAPKLTYQIPLNARAAATQIGVVSGLGIVLP